MFLQKGGLGGQTIFSVAMTDFFGQGGHGQISLLNMSLEKKYLHKKVFSMVIVAWSHIWAYSFY